MTTAIFPVQRLANGAGHSNLTLITEDAIPDASIGSLLLVPFVDGYKDAQQVEVVTDDKGEPIATNLRTCVVVRYIYN